MSSEDDHDQQQQFVTKAHFDQLKSNVKHLIEMSNSAATGTSAVPALAMAQGPISVTASSFVGLADPDSNPCLFNLNPDNFCCLLSRRSSLKLRQ